MAYDYNKEQKKRMVTQVSDLGIRQFGRML